MTKFTPIAPDLHERSQTAEAAVCGRLIPAGGERPTAGPFDREAGLQAADQIMAPARVAAGDRRGRGAALNPKGRFEKLAVEAVPEGAESADDDTRPPGRRPTQVQAEKPRHIISRNDSPDIPYDFSINPYRGCEHGCIYCYARPSHAYMGLSAGLDFETRLFARPEAAALLRRELAQPSYRPHLIVLGSNTDPYQPVEKRYGITRSVLETLFAARHPVRIITKSALVLRDSDILAAMARERLAHVAFSITSLDNRLARRLEPRAAAPARRLQAMRQLAGLDVPVSLMLAPVIPALNDHEIENIVRAAADAGAITADYTLLRLPYEVAPLFKDWLLRHYPDKYRRIIGQLRLLRGGKDNDARPHSRMRGQGVPAALLARRFQLATARYGLNRQKIHLTRCLFRVPPAWLPTAEGAPPHPPAPARQQGGAAASKQSRAEQQLLLL